MKLEQNTKVNFMITDKGLNTVVFLMKEMLINLLKILDISVCLLLLSVNIYALEVPDDEVFIYGQAKTFKTPMRIHSVIVSDTGYYPSSIMVYKGEKLKLFVTGADNKPSCLMIPEKNIFLSAEKGVITEGEVSFDHPGIYNYFCPSKRNIKGKIVVMQRKEETDRIKREIASKNKTKKKWFPREKPTIYK